MESKNLTHTPAVVDSKKVKQEIAAAIGNSTIADSILASFNNLATQGQLTFPKNYPVGNQLKLMYTVICQNNDLSKLTSDSVGQALAEAVIEGLEIEKNQVYFFPRGNKLKMFRSYYGDAKVAKETGLVKDIFARPIYQDDTYEESTDELGNEIIINHKTKLENHDKEIIGGYAWAIMTDGKTKRYCIMTRKEIDAAWAKSSDPTRNVQKTFPQEMCKRTTIRRLVKMIFNTALESGNYENNAIIGSYNRTTEDEYENEPVKETKSTIKNLVCDENGVPLEAEVKPAEPNEEITPESFCKDKGIE